jgi:hypothetical protein
MLYSSNSFRYSSNSQKHSSLNCAVKTGFLLSDPNSIAELIRHICCTGSFVNFSGNVGKVGLSLVSTLKHISSKCLILHFENNPKAGAGLQIQSDANYVIVDGCRCRYFLTSFSQFNISAFTLSIRR